MKFLRKIDLVIAAALQRYRPLRSICQGRRAMANRIKIDPVLVNAASFRTVALPAV